MGLRFLAVEADAPDRRSVQQQIHQLLGGVEIAIVYDQSGGLIDLWSAGLILLTAVGIQKTSGPKERVPFPPGLTLVFWWGLASLFGQPASH